MLNRIVWFMKSDVKIETQTCWYERTEKIDSFMFYTKKPFSKAYQYHAAIGLEYTYKILELIQRGIRDENKAIHLAINSGMGRENIYIWKSSLRKAEEQMFSMIKEIQGQY